MNLVCNCGVALFHFVLSYLPLASNPSQRERTTLDSWLRLVARGFIRWSTFQKLKTKIFLRKNRYIGAQPIREIHLQREQKTAEAWRIRRKIEDIWRSIPKKGILNEKMDLNILISQLNHDVQNEMKVSFEIFCQKTFIITTRDLRTATGKEILNGFFCFKNA